MADGHDHQSELLGAIIRSGHPDFLDLPWGKPFDQWSANTDRVEDLPKGPGRHPVLFVNYGGCVYALKELPHGLAEKEFNLLRQLEEGRLPAVMPVGHAGVRSPHGKVSVLITQYLERSWPCHVLLERDDQNCERAHLLDALACLLVQLHLGGVFWGDCSLNNTLYRRDAGCLNAYLVDAETAALFAPMAKGSRNQDLEVMEENVRGVRLDLGVGESSKDEKNLLEVGPYIRKQYEALWVQVTQEELVLVGERYRIQDRVRALNDLGFSVKQIELIPTGNGEHVRLRAFVTDRRYHHDLLRSLTGLEIEEMQARTMLNEIHELRAAMAAEQRQDTPVAAAAHAWLEDRYLPATRLLTEVHPDPLAPAEMYCQLLEHKWYLSEAAQHDVGHAAALGDLAEHWVDQE